MGSGPADDLRVFGSTADGEVAFNVAGWPAQHWATADAEGDTPQLDNVADCISVWEVLFQGDEPSVSDEACASKTEYKASYHSGNACRYEYRANTQLSITYDSTDGSVVVDADLNS